MRAIPHEFLLVCTPICVQTNIFGVKTRDQLDICPIFVKYRGGI